MNRAVEKGRMSSEERDASLGRIHPASSPDALKEPDLVVEAIVEKEETKTSLFALLDGLRPEGTIAITALVEGVATPETIDTARKLGVEC